MEYSTFSFKREPAASTAALQEIRFKCVDKMPQPTGSTQRLRFFSNLETIPEVAEEEEEEESEQEERGESFKSNRSVRMPYSSASVDLRLFRRVQTACPGSMGLSRRPKRYGSNSMNSTTAIMLRQRQSGELQKLVEHLMVLTESVHSAPYDHLLNAEDGDRDQQTR
ncbi:hypothetical protein FVE85_2938 [Porphyridium purpureum]|uniref:Uncharacterized protein n=1 Tax=Porphyridium purpureum TaxID=35688 RepID=A0A5J4YW96_PORPP|nr:hypothetical protein FVE85_2938 [Porphyridium purpureum]|eukprot:POR3227..scf227_4